MQLSDARSSEAGLEAVGRLAPLCSWAAHYRLVKVLLSNKVLLTYYRLMQGARRGWRRGGERVQVLATELEDTATCWDCQVGAGDLHIPTCFQKLDLTPDQGDTVCLGTAGGRVLAWDTRADAVAVVAGARAGAAVDKVRW